MTDDRIVPDEGADGAWRSESGQPSSRDTKTGSQSPLAQVRVHRVLVALYIVAMIAIEIAAGEPTSLWWWPFAAIFTVWLVAPIVSILAFDLLWGHSHRWRLLATLWLIGVGISSISIYIHDIFGPDTRSTSALILVFLPIYMWGAVVVLLLLYGASRLIEGDKP